MKCKFVQILHKALTSAVFSTSENGLNMSFVLLFRMVRTERATRAPSLRIADNKEEEEEEEENGLGEGGGG